MADEQSEKEKRFDRLIAYLQSRRIDARREEDRLGAQIDFIDHLLASFLPKEPRP